MTNIHIPLKTRIKAIQNNKKKYDDVEIPDNEGLKVKLKTSAKNDITRENNELKSRVQQLEESLQRAREESFLSGIEEGKEQLRKEVETKINAELDYLKKNIKKILSDVDKEIKKLDRPILSLSKEIAKRILDTELNNADKYNELLLSQIGRILHEMMDQEIITIHVSPSQIEWILKADLEKELHIPEKIKIKFFEDHNLKPGECLLESSNLLVEGKFQTQLDQIENQLSNM